MFQRYLFGGYNASTTLLLGVVFIVALILIEMASGMVGLPLVGLVCYIGYGCVAWGACAAGQGPNTEGFGSFCCWAFGLLLAALLALVTIGPFVL